MRRLLPTARSFLFHSGQGAAWGAVAVLAMAAAPLTSGPAPNDGAFAVPEAPPMTAVAEPAGPVTRLIAFEMPVKGYGINSPFGMRRLRAEAAARRHEGVDIAAPQGTSVFSSAEGRVLRTGYDAAGYGRFVEIRHPNGMTTLYGHLSRIDVASGETVDAGLRIGLVGSTGRSTGPHLHFEVRRGERQVNPVNVAGHTFEVVAATT